MTDLFNSKLYMRQTELYTNKAEKNIKDNDVNDVHLLYSKIRYFSMYDIVIIVTELLSCCYTIDF